MEASTSANATLPTLNTVFASVMLMFPTTATATGARTSAGARSPGGHGVYGPSGLLVRVECDAGSPSSSPRLIGPGPDNFYGYEISIWPAAKGQANVRLGAHYHGYTDLTPDGTLPFAVVPGEWYELKVVVEQPYERGRAAPIKFTVSVNGTVAAGLDGRTDDSSGTAARQQPLVSAGSLAHTNVGVRAFNGEASFRGLRFGLGGGM